MYLKKEHACYYQIQMQMQLSQANYCDFVLWREDKILHQRISLYENFIDDTFQKAEILVKMAILPELNRKWFSIQNAMPTHVRTKTRLLLTLCHKGGFTVVKMRASMT